MRYIEEQDIELISSWHDKYENWPIPAEELRSPIGAINKMCAGWLYYMQGSPMAIIEFVIADKDYREKDRDDLIEELIEFLCDRAKSDGYKIAWAWIKNEKLIEKYKNQGFMTSAECVELVKPL